MMLLSTTIQNGTIRGNLIEPQHHTEDWLGEFSGISLPIVSLPIEGVFKGRSVELTVRNGKGADEMRMRLSDDRHALLNRYHSVVPDWKFVRVSDLREVHVSTDWPSYDSDPDVVAIRSELRSMAEQDKSAREKQHPDLNALGMTAESNKPFLDSVFEKYGWPKISVFDVIACNDFWLLVQHQSFEVQRRMLPAIKEAVNQDEASKSNYAYLFDRVQIEEGKLQRWGTQSRCVNGKAVSYPIEDAVHVDERRAIAGLGTFKKSLKASSVICKRLDSHE